LTQSPQFTHFTSILSISISVSSLYSHNHRCTLFQPDPHNPLQRSQQIQATAKGIDLSQGSTTLECLFLSLLTASLGHVSQSQIPTPNTRTWYCLANQLLLSWQQTISEPARRVSEIVPGGNTLPAEIGSAEFVTL